MNNPIKNNHSINSLAKQRWSTRAFSSQPVENEKLLSILEAARWASSAFNEQPWRFIVGNKGGETYDKILSTLVDWNISWAKNAPVLILNIGKKTFTHNNKQNVTFKYDLGQAVATMTLEAVNQGLHSHQMSGFDPEKATALFNIPDDFQAVSITAIGYYGNHDKLPEDIASMEKNERTRNNIDKFVFGDEFGKINNI